tara:strand:- start:275 stop:595 length:321 start_codon:yes stop_codon:yes gene_type:complete
MKIQSDHLDEKNISYLKHASEALGISLGLFSTGFKMLVHAVAPDVFTTAASDYAAELQNKLNNTPKKQTNTYGTFNYEKVNETEECVEEKDIESNKVENKEENIKD